LENAVYLCQPHHDEYDSKPSQTKGITPDELRAHQLALYEIITSPDWLVLSGQPLTHRKGLKHRIRGVTLEVYERRIPIYQKTIEFVREVVRDLRPGFGVTVQFVRETEQALFLFDETVAQHLDEMSRKALRLHTVNMLIDGINQGRGGENFSALVNEHTELALWFTGQYDVIRNHFAPFLRLA